MAEPQIIEVAIPDGVGPGDEFLVEFDGTQFNIGVPDGCGPGDAIQVEVPASAEEPPAEPAAPQIIEVAIPDGVGPGDEFLVEFNGTQFNIGVPDGCGPGDAIQVEVPASAEEPPAEPEPEPEPEPAKPSVDQAADKAAGLTLSDSNSRGGSSASSGRSGTKSSSSASSSYSKKPVYSSFDDGYDDPPYRKSSPFDYDYGSSYAPKWEPEPSVFDGGFVLAGEHAEKCGDFMVGQLVQVTRNDGSWTYGKIQEYDQFGDNYTVLTKMGPKYFVERADLTDDIVTNPSDGSCAQQ